MFRNKAWHPKFAWRVMITLFAPVKHLQPDCDPSKTISWVQFGMQKSTPAVSSHQLFVLLWINCSSEVEWSVPNFTKLVRRDLTPISSVTASQQKKQIDNRQIYKLVQKLSYPFSTHLGFSRMVFSVLLECCSPGQVFKTLLGRTVLQFNICLTSKKLPVFKVCLNGSSKPIFLRKKPYAHLVSVLSFSPLIHSATSFHFLPLNSLKKITRM